MKSDTVSAKNLKKVKGIKLILGYIGLMMGLIGIIIALPLLYILFNSAEYKYAYAFLIPSSIYIVVGFTLFFILTYKKKPEKLFRHQDSVIVMTSWIIAIIGCALPFTISKLMTFHQAVFEMSSGWATVGMSIYNFKKGANCFLLARTNTMLFGGLGIILVMISLFSDRYGMSLYSCEGHPERFTPNLLRSARLIVIIYIGLIILGTIGLLCCGMSLFDAFNHSVTAVSTGGFSTQPESLLYFKSRLSSAQYIGIMIVSMCLMLLGSISSLSWVFLIKGKFKSFAKSSENRAQLIIMVIAIPLLLLAFTRSGFNSSDSTTYAFFYTFSALTTCGFQVSEISASLHSSVFFIIITLMLIGGQSSSTAGGLKIIRLHVLFKSIYIKIKNTLTPSNTTHSYRVNTADQYTNLDDSTMHGNNTFVLIYLLFYFIGVFIFSFSGTELKVILFEVASFFSGTGLSTGILITADSPNYFYYVSSVLMVAGRLEIMVMIYALVYCINTPYRYIKYSFERRIK